MDVIEIPTNKPVIRKDLPDVVYKTENGKFNAVVEQVKECHEKGQPVLVGTVSIETSERLSNLLKRHGIKHQVLNAKYHEKEAEIVEFAELGDFIDMPVRTYSSGMYSKLAFSITAILETDIMLIDEVLSVGDQKFKKKSYEKMKSLISNKDRTVIIVSHSLDTLEELCDTVMWMHDGQIRRIGEPKPVLEEYVDFMEKN